MMRILKHSAPGAICGILIGLVVSACASEIKKPLVKWWFNDAKEERMFIRKTCDEKENCIVAERLSYQEADGYYAISPLDWETRENYIRSLERNCK